MSRSTEHPRRRETVRRVKRVASASAILITLLLAGCSTITAGTIVEKSHKDAYSYTTQICHYYNEKGVCTLWMPQTNHVPERWNLRLQNDEEAGWITVSEETYNAHDVGDYIDLTPADARSDRASNG